MSIRTILLAALVTLAAACGKDAATADCGAVGTAMSKGMKKLPDDARARLVPAVVDACKRDAWSAEATSCFGNARSDKDAKACVGKLSGAQATTLQAAIQAAAAGS